jgi:ketosteroid isomerase-like protein
MSYLEKTKDIYNMIGQGQLLEAFDKYYAENVVMEEPMGSREGKVACREYEVQFLNSVQEVHDLQVRKIAADEDNGVVFVENMMDVTFKDGNRVKMEQTAVQQWEGDQIVHERFYYDGSH